MLNVIKCQVSYQGHTVAVFTPQSTLSKFSKILEKLFNIRLEHFLDANKILSDIQYGFRPGMFTVHAAAELVEQMSSAIDGQSCYACEFIDLEKHSIQWIMNYL